MSSSHVICVDLDGTLIRTDVLLESVLRACRSWGSLKALPRLLMGGKACLKEGLAAMCPPACDRLPYDRELVSFLIERKAAGDRLVLATATNRAVAACINAHLGFLFDEVMASDRFCNLKGENKARALVERFGERGFTYIGNSTADLKVWRNARSAMIVGASASLVRRARRMAPVERVFSSRPAQFRAFVHALEPFHWIKNTLMFVPLFAADAFSRPVAWAGALCAALAFCMIGSAARLCGGLLRIEADRGDAWRREGPLVGGALDIGWAIYGALALGLFGLAAALWAGVPAWTLTYGLSAFLLSLRRKQTSFAGPALLAANYLIRLAAGLAFVEQPLSL